RIECANNGLPEHIANILKTPDDRLVFDGSDWLGSLEKALGPREWKQCGGMWRMRARSGVEHAKALRNATEDCFTLTPAERSKIRNRAAWITDRYERGFEKIEKSRAVTASRDRGRESPRDPCLRHSPNSIRLC